MSIKVFLVDDQALVRSGFRMLIEAEDDLEVVGEAPDGAVAVAELARVPADVVLMDIRMPRMDGVEATKRLAAAGNPARVLVLTTFDLDEYVFAALQGGRQRLPAQGRASGGTAVGDPQCGGRRRRRGAQRDPPTAATRRCRRCPHGRRSPRPIPDWPR